MSFEIRELSANNWRCLTLAVENIQPGDVPADSTGEFTDGGGRRYRAVFDGCDVIFSHQGKEYAGRWIQGTAATVIYRTRRLPQGFNFTFLDHGKSPQRLHAVWTFDGSAREAVQAWRSAGFFLSRIDNYFNRNHPRRSIHLRTRGASFTGADSAHIVIDSLDSQDRTAGNIHVGEFNPLTGFGVGFFLHHLEGWR